MLAFLLYFVLAVVAAVVVFGCGVRLHCWVRRLSTASRSMAFLHPFCADMAGGERVLWAAILAVQTKVAEPFNIFVYVLCSMFIFHSFYSYLNLLNQVMLELKIEQKHGKL